MKRFKNILLVHSERVGSDDTLSRASELARGNAAHLTIIDVISDVDATPMLLLEKGKRLRRLGDSLRHERVETSVVVRSGTPFLEIVRQVLRNKHDLVIMTADGANDFRQLLFGSTSMHLMRKCPCPVWVMKAHRPAASRKILAAVAWPGNEVPRDELNVLILDFATSLARMEGSELHILHAWDFTGADADTIRSEITDEIRDRLTQQNELLHRSWLEQLLASYHLKDIRHQIHLVRGRAESTIVQLVDDVDVDLIVMGSLRRAGIPGFLIGSTAESVLGQVDQSVLTMKPASFQTPVTLKDDASVAA